MPVSNTPRRRKTRQRIQRPATKIRKSLPAVKIHSTAHTHISSASVRQLVARILDAEGGRDGGGVSVVFVSDPEIRNLNARFLKKDRPTDVMAFPFDEPGRLRGEVYISLERARVQAGQYHVSFEEELSRLVIHGVLHLLGYDDRSPSKRKIMKGREEFYLSQGIRVRTNSKIKK